MANYSETVEQVTDQYLSAVSNAQNAVVDAVSTFVSKLPKAADIAPSVELPKFEVPAGVPTLEEVNAASFAAIEAIIANQKAFAEKFLAATKV